ncbi:MAG: tRNA-(ms[2]io[6]A)-hydroxylase [Steroidobacteraceae bacterium]|nr:tRNA-(ms[2]io[6]A)-hydroxylase [Steroidobacteraceae bacterium]
MSSTSSGSSLGGAVAVASTASPVLAVPTPVAWFDAAPRHRDVLLVDHANCEKKAASTALALMFSYADDAPLGLALSRLAREELRHYEQVVRLMRELGVAYGRLAPSRYAAGLRRVIRGTEPARKLDLMLCGALIEARSCERFHGLAPRLEPRIAEFYRGLEAAESRHQGLYLDLARRHAREHGLDADSRLVELAAVEADLVTAPDREFRFHSGPP